MSTIKLYKLNLSPAVRATLLTGNALNITFEQHDVDIFNGGHINPEYLKMNPLHTIPILNDNGRIIYDSHVINTYLVGKYGKDDSLYPKDLYKRALVDQKLAFDLGIIFVVLKKVALAYFKKEIKSLTPAMTEDLKTAYDFLETMLERKEWVALDHLTVADFSCYTTMSCLEYHKPIDGKVYPNIRQWFDRCKNHPLFCKDAEHCKLYAEHMKSIGA